MSSSDAVSDDDDIESFYSFNESVDSSNCLGSSLSSLKSSRSNESLPDEDFTENAMAPNLEHPVDEQLDVSNLTLDEDLPPRDYHQFNVNDPRSVPPLKSKNQPDVDLFDMNNPYISTEAIDKYNFTKKWAEAHQQKQYSPLYKLQCNLKKEGNNEQQQELEERNKGILNKDLFLSPVDPRFPHTMTRQDDEPTEPYVSPFEDMPVVKDVSKEMSKKLGIKAPTVVPAGFDLTSLVEYKDPNHWARCPSHLFK
ncbi:uncharacterized protein Dwil_GK22731 [Drosophila willistoni]|uniref:Uncharacterized protein n=1 Tax=Drosophila willistoni TaxID=7260 RepID=B4NFY0_DROWI|nr:uncharacterized protein LOC6649502 [Drosophila willistoni]EDW83197.1 uncharacterized protein Dwil_GK22731 [Drosophila willistoni]